MPDSYPNEYGKAIRYGAGEPDTPSPELLRHATAVLLKPTRDGLASWADHLEDTHPGHPGAELIRRVLEGKEGEDIGDELLGTAHTATQAGPHAPGVNQQFRAGKELVRRWDNKRHLVFEPFETGFYQYTDARTVPRLPAYFSPEGRSWFRVDQLPVPPGEHRLYRPRRYYRPTEITPEQTVNEVVGHGGLHNLAHLLAGIYYFHPDTVARREGK